MRTVWSIGKFDEDLKNRFVALAKINKKTVPELLEKVINSYFKKLEKK